MDREEIKSTEQLMNHLRKYETSVCNKGKEEFKVTQIGKKTIEEKRKLPRHICSLLGKPERYHPSEICRNKQRFEPSKKSVNVTEIEEEINIEAENQKN